MARKVRRVRPGTTRETPKGTKTATAAKPAALDEETLREEYAYVTKDLRRVVTLAGLMFLLLIALNLLL